MGVETGSFTKQEEEVLDRCPSRQVILREMSAQYYRWEMRQSLSNIVTTVSWWGMLLLTAKPISDVMFQGDDIAHAALKMSLGAASMLYIEKVGKGFSEYFARRKLSVDVSPELWDQYEKEYYWGLEESVATSLQREASIN